MDSRPSLRVYIAQPPRVEVGQRVILDGQHWRIAEVDPASSYTEYVQMPEDPYEPVELVPSSVNVLLEPV